MKAATGHRQKTPTPFPTRKHPLFAIIATPLSLMQNLTDRRPPLTAVRIYIHGGKNRSSGQWLFCGFPS